MHRLTVSLFGPKILMNDTAVNLFNSYLNTASQSPRVIAASRPSSPLKDKLNEVNTIAEKDESKDDDNINDIGKDKENDKKGADQSSAEKVQEDVDGIDMDESQQEDFDMLNTEDEVLQSDAENEISDAKAADLTFQPGHRELEESSVEEISLGGNETDYKNDSTAKKSRRKKKKTKKRLTVRRDSPSVPRRGVESSSRSLSPFKSETRTRASSANKLKGHDGLIMENLIPVYSELVDGIFKRPIVVSILAPQDKVEVARTVTPAGPMSRDKSRMIAYAAMYQEKAHKQEDNDSITEANFIESHHINRITHKKTNFLLKVYDLVESKHANYEVDVKHFLKLRFDFKHPEYYPLLRTYYKPQNLSWWAKHVKNFTIIFVKPTSELSVVIDKNVLKSYVTKKIKHHIWMQSAVDADEHHVPAGEASQDMRSRPGTASEVQFVEPRVSLSRRDTNVSVLSTDDFDLQSVPSPSSPNLASLRTPTKRDIIAFDYWQNFEDFYFFKIAREDRVGKNWDLMEQIFASGGSKNAAERVVDDIGEGPLVLSAAWETLEAVFRNTPSSERLGPQWEAAAKLFQYVHDNENIAKDSSVQIIPNSDLNDPANITKSSKGKKKKKKKIANDEDDSQQQRSVTSLPPLSHQGSLTSKSTVGSGGSGSVSRTRRHRLSPVLARRVKTAPLDELKSEVVAAIDESLQQSPAKKETKESLLGQPKRAKSPVKEKQKPSKDLKVPAKEQGASSRPTVTPTTSLEGPDALDLIDPKGTSSVASAESDAENSAVSLSDGEMDSVTKEFSRSFPILADKVGRTASPTAKLSQSGSHPFEQSVSKYKISRKKEVIEIIKKARKEVSKDKDFINRKISKMELKLLESPLSQKLYREPKADLMQDLSIGSRGGK